MKLTEIPEGLRFEYKNFCKCCGQNHKILTTSRDFPEYEAEIYLQCICGDFVEFCLPVN